MRLFAFVLIFLLGGAVTAYTPVGSYVPPKDEIITSVRNAAPFLANWLPDVSVDKAQGANESSLLSVKPTTQVADKPAKPVEPIVQKQAELSWEEFDPEDVALLLTDMDLPNVQILMETGDSYIAVERDEAFNFYLRPRLCKEAVDCVGLQMFSTFDLPSTPELLTQLNETYAFVKFYTDADGLLILETYVSTEFGVSRQNMKSNIEMFVAVLDTFSATLQPESPDIESSS